MTNREKLHALQIKPKGSKIKNLLIFVIIILIIGIYAVHMWNVSGGNTATKKKSEVDKLISRDLEVNYPGTPREVMRFYSRILKCYYNQELSEEQIESLASQMRCLFDYELLEQNPKETYLNNVKTEISRYRKANEMITNCVIDESSNVQYSTVNGEKYAAIYVAYTTRKKSDYQRVYEQFLMRYDSENNWKIVGWKQVEPDAFQLETED